MKTVAMCGSLRFETQMREIALELELDYGFNVIQLVYNTPGRTIGEREKEILAKAHAQKILLSDAIYVVDIGGYMGQSVREELAFAQAHGKEIIFDSQFRR